MKTYFVFWVDGTLTAVPNVAKVTRDEGGTIMVLHSGVSEEGAEGPSTVLINLEQTLRVEIYPQDGYEQPEDYK